MFLYQCIVSLCWLRLFIYNMPIAHWRHLGIPCRFFLSAFDNVLCVICIHNYVVYFLYRTHTLMSNLYNFQGVSQKPHVSCAFQIKRTQFFAQIFINNKIYITILQWPMASIKSYCCWSKGFKWRFSFEVNRIAYFLNQWGVRSS